MTRKSLFAFLTVLFWIPSAHAQRTVDDITTRQPSSTSDEDLSAESAGEGDAGASASDRYNASQALPPTPALGSVTLSRKQYDDLRDRLDMMEGDIERLLGEQDELKEKSQLDRLNWSGSYRFNMNFFNLYDHTFVSQPSRLELLYDDQGNPVINPETNRQDAIPVPYGYRDRNEWLSPAWTHRLKLAMTYDFGENLRFYSQLGVYKFFNENVNTDGIIDHGANAYPRDNSFRLERVYFDWFVTDRLAISVGRIASPDGPPTEMKENTDRRSGWGVQMVNATMDTVMTTLYLRDKMYLRTFYSPFGAHMEYQVNNDISLFDDQGLDILHSWGALFESAIPGMKDSILQLGFIHIPKFPPQDIKIHVPGTDTWVSPSEPTGQDLGMFLQASTLLQFKDIGNSGLDAFVSYNFTLLNPTGESMIYDVPQELAIYYPDGSPFIPPGADSQVIADTSYELHLGLASSENGAGSKNVGHAIYTGIRYTLPISEEYPTRIGGEFNWGSKYHVAWSHPNDQLLNKLGNKGLSFEGYVIQQLVPEHLFCRVGYLELQRNYVGGFIGPTDKVEQRIRNIYFLVDLAW